MPISAGSAAESRDGGGGVGAGSVHSEGTAGELPGAGEGPAAGRFALVSAVTTGRSRMMDSSVMRDQSARLASA